MAGPLEAFGEAVGRAFAGLAAALLTGLQQLFKFVLEKRREVQDAFKPILDEFAAELFKDLTAMTGAGSPPEEINAAVTSYYTELVENIKRVGKELEEKKGHQVDVWFSAAKWAAQAVAGQTTAEGSATAVDAAHPLRRLAIPDMVRNIIATVGLMAVVGAITRLPLEASVLRPLGQAVNELFPTEIPMSMDLVRMQVREVFDPTLRAEQLTLTEGYDEYLMWMSKHGLSKFHADSYWAAHWVLISNTEAFEMFHRGELSREELEAVLRRNDVLPFYIPKLINIAYGLVTRVDARRLFAVGVWDRSRIERHYRELGLKPEDAADLTEWTVRSEGRATLSVTKDLTRTDVLKLYRIGDLNRADALERLQELDYDENEADALLRYEDFKRAEEPRELSRSQIEDAYELSLYTRDRAKAELKAIDYGEEAAETILRIVDVKREARRVTRPRERDLSVKNIFDAYSLGKGVIAWNDVLAYLQFLGYDEWELSVLVWLQGLTPEGKEREITVVS